MFCDYYATVDQARKKVHNNKSVEFLIMTGVSGDLAARSHFPREWVCSAGCLRDEQVCQGHRRTVNLPGNCSSLLFCAYAVNEVSENPNLPESRIARGSWQITEIYEFTSTSRDVYWVASIFWLRMTGKENSTLLVLAHINIYVSR